MKKWTKLRPSPYPDRHIIFNIVITIERDKHKLFKKEKTENEKSG